MLGIALSGGGARGIVHVGVLKALEEEGIFPDVISGTSAGAIVGSLYASGYSPDEIREISMQRNLMRMFGLKLPSKGFVRHTFLRKMLTKYLADNSFDNLKKPLLVTIANLNSGQPETKESGPLIDYVVASSSIPILFEPLSLDGNLYVDGGLLRNLPASPLRPKCDVVIGVNLVPQVPLMQSDMKTVIGVGQRCFDLAALNNIRPQLDYCDVVIEPADIHQYSRFNFIHAKEMYEIGYAQAKQQMDVIRKSIEV